jgi:hypothetical protein
MNTREYNFWFVLQRAEDVPGEWTAHCLELDVVSQGTSLRHALAMLNEACFITVCDDIFAGRDPLDRRAPARYWDELYKIVGEGKKADFSTLEESKVRSIVCQVQIKCLLMQPAIRPVKVQHRPKVPLAWTEPATAQACCG